MCYEISYGSDWPWFCISKVGNIDSWTLVISWDLNLHHPSLDLMTVLIFCNVLIFYNIIDKDFIYVLVVCEGHVINGVALWASLATSICFFWPLFPSNHLPSSLLLMQWACQHPFVFAGFWCPVMVPAPGAEPCTPVTSDVWCPAGSYTNGCTYCADGYHSVLLLKMKTWLDGYICATNLNEIISSSLVDSFQKSR